MGIFVFGLDVVGSLPLLAIFIILSIIMILGIGMAIGGWAEEQSQAAPISNIIVFPMLFLSGAFFPRFLMPDWLQTASAWFPLTPVIDGIRMITTRGVGITSVYPQFLMVIGWLIVIYLIAFKLFRWE